MAGKFLDIKEAAQQLGVSPDDLVEMRSRGEIRGFRDGSSWKFKLEDVEKAASERAESSDSPGGPFGSFQDSDDDQLGLAEDEVDSGAPASEDAPANEDARENELESESILVSEEELGHSDESTSSTIIGKLGDAAGAKDSDLQLTREDDSDLGLLADESGKSSDLQLPSQDRGAPADREVRQPPAEELAAEDDLRLAPEEGSSLSLDSEKDSTKDSDRPATDSDVELVAESGDDSDVRLIPHDSDVLIGGDAEPKASSGSGTGDLGDSVLSLGDDDLDLGEDLVLSEASELSMSDESDDDLVLGESGSDVGSDVGSAIGSDITLGSGDSGINLTTPSDSGLSLEDEPLELGDSGISALELPEDDEVISLDSMADPDEATQLKQDEEFLLSPSDDLAGDDESDSGSQVIALEDSAAFEEDAATMVHSTEPALLAEETELEGFDVAPSGAPMGAPAAAGAAAVPGQVPEAPYSAWNVVGLLATILPLMLAGMLMVDVVRNMWSWNGTGNTTTSLMELMLKVFSM